MTTEHTPTDPGTAFILEVASFTLYGEPAPDWAIEDNYAVDQDGNYEPSTEAEADDLGYIVRKARELASNIHRTT